MALLSTPRERYLGGFYVEEDDLYDAVYRGRHVRYVIVLDSYADAVSWRRLMAGEGGFIIPLSQAAGESAKQLRNAIAVADAHAAAAANAEPTADTLEDEGDGIEPAALPVADPLGDALEHLRALLVRRPAYTDYDDLFVAVEKCAYCEADLADGHHTADCAWQAARRFLLETVLARPAVTT